MKKLRDLIDRVKKLQEDLKSSEIPVEPDEDGYIDKECPNKDCMFSFKVLLEDWETKFNNGKVFCPNCKNEGPANSYYPSQFIEEVKEQLINHSRNRIFNDISFPQKLMPYKSIENWKLKIECEECKSKYSVIGSAFFCPCCGNNSVEKHFEDSINKITIKINEFESVKESLNESIGVDKSNTIIRSLKESCLSDCVVSFQFYMNSKYKNITGHDPSFNLFQKVKNASDELKNTIGQGYEDWLTNHEIDLMKKLFQQRHLFQHNDGIVDQKYIERSGDSNYKIGQRIVVNDSEILKLTDVIIKISNEIKEYDA